jgi:hypothetical protein
LNSNKAKHFKVDEGDIQKVEESACLGSVIWRVGLEMSFWIN